MNQAFNQLLSFKKGGSFSNTLEKKKEKLFPFFAYLYSKELNPEKYGSVNSIEDWSSIIQNNEEDISVIVKAATQLTEEDWNSLEKQYNQIEKDKEIQVAAKGTKLKETSKKKKKCSCGCDLILSKEKGGKIIETCACGCNKNKK